MNATEFPPAPSRHRRNDFTVAAACGLFVGAMVGAAFAAVPFYNWFCRTTGFGGTTQVAAVAPTKVLDRKITVRFDSNVSGGLPWRFEPEQNSVAARIGEVVTVNFIAINDSARETTAQASYNVAPLTVGSYFTKINCFCFTQQTLGPGEKREMPVVFFVDPALAKDAEQDDVDTITLSYTMYPVCQREPQRVESIGARSRITD
jgi:cytochrome c oxidase assembly protein subunit 11